MKGKELQKALCDLARTLGWRAAHFPSVPVKYQNQPVRWLTPIYADGKGFPDVLLVRERVIVVEVKGTGDSTSAEQEAWLSAFRIAGVSAFVWTPDDWGPDGVIETELKRRARRDPIVPEPALAPDAFDAAFARGS